MNLRDYQRMAALELDVDEYLARRDSLRRAYAAMIPKPRMCARTTLGYGSLFPLTDPSAKLSVVTLSRPFTDEEWEHYRRSPACERVRKSGELHE